MKRVGMKAPPPQPDIDRDVTVGCHYGGCENVLKMPRSKLLWTHDELEKMRVPELHIAGLLKLGRVGWWVADLKDGNIWVCPVHADTFEARALECAPKGGTT